MIFKRVLAKLCLFFRDNKRIYYRLMNSSPIALRNENRLLRRAITRFFKSNSPEMVKYFTLIIFQCWALNDCKLKADVTDKDFAEFLDQLNDLVSSSYRYHHKLIFKLG